jgi:hypothetical protein
MSVSGLRRIAAVVVASAGSLLITSPVLAGDDPYADVVVSYAAGSAPAPGFTNPATALGEPERLTGEPLFPAAVTPFQGAFLTSEIVSIGGGGSLVLKFNTPVSDDPANPFGIDLLVFGNSFFLDEDFPSAVVGGINAEGGTIEVSDDGTRWHVIPGMQADGLFPTRGYSDVAAYAEAPGRVLTDFTEPVDPSIVMEDLLGLGYDEVIAVYAGSGGGAGVDLASVGLEAISYIRVSNPVGAPFSVEIDAVSDVAPAALFADLNGDGQVDGIDLALLLGAWGPGGGAADLNLDGQVNGFDLALLLGAWTG